jgi:hypothetical protein
MLCLFKKYLLSLGLIFISLLMAGSSVFGASYTIDARDDAGTSPGQAADLGVQFYNGTAAVYHADLGSISPQTWASYTDIGNYIDNNITVPVVWTSWELQSAGNVWSTDTIVGDCLSNLSAGKYRVIPLSGAFAYTYGVQENRWELQVTWGDDNQFLGSQMIGFNDPLDITVGTGGWVWFWIWDTNSIDNSGSLTFDISRTPVPEPSSLLLLGIGLASLIRRKK